ncbi:MAG TPA: hypothetical protein VHZ07_09510 [Bryobacteraceae bacterium]|jgi:hypothetical protein|nr:hypothetical protein [Bryobacteraceae bacterium]
MVEDGMTDETLRKLKEQFQELKHTFTSLSGSSDYSVAIQELQALTKDMPLLAPFLRDAAERMMPEATRGNTVRPEMFTRYLAAIDTEEKFDLVLASMTESDGQQLSRHLTQMLKSVLPNIREDGLETLKKLPHRRGGGRKKEVDDERAERICKKIAKHIESGVSIGDAQRRVSKDERLSERTVREVWQNRKKRHLVTENS